jgi:ZIP family zinc transporter
MDAITTGMLFSLLAGLSTAVGGLTVFFIKKFRKSYLGFSLAFSTGVMITISFVEMLPEAMSTFGYVNALIAFFAGAAIAFLIDFIVPHSYIMEKFSNGSNFNPRLFRVGLLVALGLAIHNFPEGFAVFAGNLHSIGLGIIITVAIALHNIPEGISVAMPVYYATKNRKKAFFISFLSGISEPVGALIAALVLLPFLSPMLIGASLALVAGIMIYICVDELLPTAYSCANKKSHMMTFAFLLGSIVMGISLILLR